MSKWLLVAAIIGIVLVSGCTGQTTCEAPTVKIGDKCCIDADSNGICDSDEAKAAQDAQQAAPPDVCGDGTCSSSEAACEYDSTSDRYVLACSADCDNECPAHLYLSSSYLKGKEDYPFVCGGYSEDVCTELGSNKFRIAYKIGPYKNDERGVFAMLKNVGQQDAENVQSSFKCRLGNDTVAFSSDKDSYNGVVAKDYFWNRLLVTEKVVSLEPVSAEKSTSQEDSKWYIYYYLHFDVHDIEESFDVICDVSLSSGTPSWKDVHVIEVSFVK